MPNTQMLCLRRGVVMVLGALAFGACSLPNDPNLNNPNVSDFSTITNLSQVQALATGVLRADRVQNENEILYGETIGRDGMRMTGSEPRFVTELLGTSINPSDFLGGALWPYATIRLANIGIHGIAAADSVAVPELGNKGKAATIGFIQTFKALTYLRAVETHDTTGAPIDVDIDPTAPPAPLRCNRDVLVYVAALLDTAATNLAAGGTSFPFSLADGFNGFDTPATFRQFNRGLAAKVDVYLAFRDYATGGIATIDQVELDSAQAALTASFMVQSAADLEMGPAHNYSTGTGDATNALFDGTPATTAYRANPRVIAEAEPNDQRVPRKTTATAEITLKAESSSVAFTLYTTQTTPTKLMTNKELLLLQAEVNWGKGNYPAALAQANFVRTHDGGLVADTASAPDSVLSRILYEKRYSLLWQSGDRWLDARLFGKLNGSNPPVGLGLERGNPPLKAFPIPTNERVARNGDLTVQACTSPIP
jgi:starch-binding outer membrane protein, SusD/RagB family